MAKYLFVYYGGGMASTPAEQKKAMAAWTAWFGKLGKAVSDMGAPVKPGKVVGKTGARAIGANPVTGYSIITAGNLGRALGMAKKCPGIAYGGRVAVYELLPM